MTSRFPNASKQTLRGKVACQLIRERLALEIEEHRKMGHKGVDGLRFQELKGRIDPSHLPPFEPDMGVEGLRFKDLKGRIDPSHPPSAVAGTPDFGWLDRPVQGKACIVGAGMVRIPTLKLAFWYADQRRTQAGLYTAMMLDFVGMPYQIYESGRRAGGRAYTHNFQQGRSTEYVDLGAPNRIMYEGRNDKQYV
jgi:hypothetical protein